MALRPLRRRSLPLDTERLALYLLGKYVVLDARGGRCSGRIVETEAYLVGDEAAHSFNGRTPRNRSLFLERGHAYVYVAYGTSFLLNVSSGPEGVGEGVLIRALEPVDGIARMERRRGTRNVHDLMRGPGRLSQAMGIDMRYDGVDFCDGGPLWLGTDGRARATDAVRTVRVGITKAAERPLRFYERDNPYVSYPRTAKVRR